MVVLLVVWLGTRTPVANGKVNVALAPGLAVHPSAQSCEQIDPAVPLYGASHGEVVSKGLNLPPYLEDDLSGRIQRLKNSGVHWVRLEFMATQSPTVGNPISQIDLNYYDQLVNSLCGAGIAVLGLVDYQTLKRSDWAISSTVSADYLSEFTSVASQLTSHFGDRIGVWEVWNEQDLAGTALTSAAYAELLHDTYWAIQGAAHNEPDGSDLVVFGGLGRIDSRALGYLRQVYEQLALRYPGERHPFDILALHPYSSELYGIETNPEIYFHWPEGAGATVIHKFLTLLTEQGDTNMPIWITEMGWNRALLDAPSASCPAISSGLVTEAQQVEYLNHGFDILLREATWPNTQLQSVTKIFWYQYRDTGVYIDCGTRSGERARPFATPLPLQAAGSEEWRQVAWWFGLYNGAFQPNQVETAFRCYATGGSNCPAVTPTFTPTSTPTQTPTATQTPTPTMTPPPSVTRVLYLPLVMGGASPPIAQPTSTPVPTKPAP